MMSSSKFSFLINLLYYEHEVASNKVYKLLTKEMSILW